MATALASQQMVPASTTSLQSCSVVRQVRTRYIYRPPIACNSNPIRIFEVTQHGQVARMVNEYRKRHADGLRRKGNMVSDPLPPAAPPDRGGSGEQDAGRDQQRRVQAVHERTGTAHKRTEQGDAEHTAGLPGRVEHACGNA